MSCHSNPVGSYHPSFDTHMASRQFQLTGQILHQVEYWFLGHGYTGCVWETLRNILWCFASFDEMLQTSKFQFAPGFWLRRHCGPATDRRPVSWLESKTSLVHFLHGFQSQIDAPILSRLGRYYPAPPMNHTDILRWAFDVLWGPANEQWLWRTSSHGIWPEIWRDCLLDPFT